MSGRSDGRALARRLALALAVVGVAVAALARRRAQSMDVYAHRGFASVAPENTADAVRAAARLADGIEIDVRRCGSGELVCVHDSDLKRIAGDDRPVADVDWETLCELPVDGSDAAVARLDDVLAAVPRDVAVVVELKERGLAADVLAAIRRHDVDAQLSSFDPRALAEARALDDDVSLAVTFRRDVDRALAIADALGCDALHPRTDRCLRTLLVPRAHRRNLAVVAWTVDSRVEALLVALSGADGVFADRPIPRG